MPRHSIDRQNQGMFLPPPREEGAMASGGLAVAIEDGFFPQPDAHVPPIEAPTISPESTDRIARLQAEHHALDSLALENRSQGRIASTSNKANRIADGIYKAPEDQDVLLEDLSEDVEESTNAKDGLRLASKGSLAESLGIKARTKTIYKRDENGSLIRDKNKKLIVERVYIATENPADQDRLDAAYRKFRIQYAGTRNRQRLIVRREQIQDEIRALRPLTSAA